MSRRKDRRLSEALAALSRVSRLLAETTKCLQQTVEMAESIAAVRDQALTSSEVWRDLYNRKPRFKLLLVSTRHDADGN
jgi:hypothetical protein